METILINGYLREVESGLLGKSNLEKQNEELSAEEYLISNGVPKEEIKRIIIDSE